jgi:hypothetical protein
LNSNFEKLEAIARAQVMIHVFGIWSMKRKGVTTYLANTLNNNMN